MVLGTPYVVLAQNIYTSGKGEALGRSHAQRRRLLGSMSSKMRRTAALLGALTLTLSLVFAGLLYQVGTTLPFSQASVVAPAQTVSATSTSSEATTPADGTEQIEDDAVPLAAPTQQKRVNNMPIHLILGFGLGFVVVFFATHIYRVNENIEKMHRKTR